MLLLVDLTKERILATIILPCAPVLPVVLTLMRRSPDSAAEFCSHRAQEKKKKIHHVILARLSRAEGACVPVVLAHGQQRLGLRVHPD